MDVDEALKVVDPKNRLQWIYAVAISAQALAGGLIILIMEFVGESEMDGSNLIENYTWERKLALTWQK